MKRLLFGTIFLALISASPVVIMAGVPDTRGVYVVAEVDADTPQGGPTGTDEKQQEQSLEKGKPTESEDKSDWKINVWPPPDNMKSPPERKEDKQNKPPDRF